MLGKYLNEYFGKGSRTRRDGAAVSGDVRKAIGRNTSILWLLLNRCKRLGGKRCKELAGCRTEVLDDGTQVKTCLNPFGLRPIFSSFVSAPPKLIPESIVEFVRGLIGIPLSDECNDGFLATTWPGDGTQIQLPPNCSLSWNYCTASVDENQPRRHAFASAKTPSQLETGETLGQLADVQRSPDYGTWGAYIDQQGPEYGKMDWISANVGTVDNPDFIVLSWKTFAARYASLPPEAKDLFYRGDVLCSLPVVTEPDQTALTFLGAGVADFEEDLPYAAGRYLVAAVLVEKPGNEIPGKVAENWVYKWLTERPHDCPGQEVPAHHGHYPVQFYIRPWRVGYQNDDLYDATTNPNGWRRLGEVLCQNFAPSTYTRVYVRPRVLAGVQFQPEGDGSSIEACWSCVDEWVNSRVHPLDNESVFHITGYQTATVTLTSVVESLSILNDEKGTFSTWNGGGCNATCSPQDELCPVGSIPDADCNYPTKARFNNSSSKNSAEYTNAEVTDLEPYCVAVDWDRDGELVTAHITQVFDANNAHGFTSGSADEDITSEYWCNYEFGIWDAEGWGGYSQTWNKISDGRPYGGFSDYNFVVSGPNEFTLPFSSGKIGRQVLGVETRSGTRIWGGHCEYWDFDLNEWVVYVSPSYGDEDARVDCVDNRHNVTELTHTGAGSNERLNLHYLDLRWQSCRYSITGYEQYAGGGFSANTSGCSTGSPQKTTTDYSYTRDGAKLEIGVVDKGQRIILEDETSGVNITTVTSSTTSASSATYGSLGLDFCDAGCAGINPTITNSSDASYPFLHRRGIFGFFQIDAIQLSTFYWLLEDVRTDYGACDEYGNMLTSTNASAVGPDKLGFMTTYKPEDFGLDAWTSYLSDETVADYYGIDELTNPRIGEIGLI